LSASLRRRGLRPLAVPILLLSGVLKPPARLPSIGRLQLFLFFDADAFSERRLVAVRPDRPIQPAWRCDHSIRTIGASIEINKLIGKIAHLHRPHDRAHEKHLSKMIAQTWRAVELIFSQEPASALLVVRPDDKDAIRS
jgi:hypothetical protein